MDHNLDDSLNLDSAMGVDFEPPGDAVVGQTDISLDASHEASLPMEFESIEEQPMLMDTENEQIIGYSDDQFTLQEFVNQQDEPAGANTTVVTSEPSISHSDTMLDIQFDPQSFVSSAVKVEPQPQLPKIIAVKAAMPPRFTAIKKESIVVSAAPRQVAIAPKPTRLALAPALARAARPTGKLPQGKTVLAQIGKQLVMMPAGTNQKIKLVTSSGGVPNIQYIRTNQGEQGQLIATKTVPGSTKPVLTKFIVQGAASSDPSNQPAVITKLMPAAAVAGAAPARFVTMHQKTVPISLPNKVFVTSPTKQTVRITKKPQFLEVKSPPPKFGTTTVQTGGTKKVVITATPAQNIIYKTTTPARPQQQIDKDGKITYNIQGQRTQLHQINVPGKGIQYIRLVTSGSAPRLKAAPAKPAASPAPAPAPAKTIVLTDTKGNVIKMAAEKVKSGQPPPLVITGTTTSVNKLTAKPQHKLVRIAPVGSKPALAAAQAAGRSSQSLLAPLSPRVSPARSPEPESKALLTDPLHIPHDPQDRDLQRQDPAPHSELAVNEVEVEFERQSPEDNVSSNSLEDESGEERRYKDGLEQPLIVLPNYLKPADILPEEFATRDEVNRYNSFDAQTFNNFQAPETPQALSESELGPSELGMRPRKACNCTKSQCLKLYCDCFANGEFCNRCNCNNCHNNLENEELRQKAIRGCLDRNPNAFRPKIGKSKSGGPEIVRRHNKGCNCKRSGCLKNYCECYEAKIACTAMCKCVGCRNVEETLERRRRDRDPRHAVFRPPSMPHINFMTTEVIEAVCQCLIAAGGEPGVGAGGGGGGGGGGAAAPLPPDPVRDVIEEFSRCLQDIINAAHHSTPIRPTETSMIPDVV
ncbi:uncharacterized protein [Choristoneura fumiferana]|uniref:uncharacterized protein n=1 Tax=Choristoneura fumiferana TaxID=7141 RepID=UPI003D157B62